MSSDASRRHREGAELAVLALPVDGPKFGGSFGAMIGGATSSGISTVAYTETSTLSGRFPLNRLNLLKLEDFGLELSGQI